MTLTIASPIIRASYCFTYDSGFKLASTSRLPCILYHIRASNDRVNTYNDKNEKYCQRSVFVRNVHD